MLSFKRKCAHHVAEKVYTSNSLSNETYLVCRGFDENIIHAEKTTCQHSTNSMVTQRIQL